MKKVKLSKIFNSSNAKCLIATLMALMMLMLASCTNAPTEKKEPVDSQNQSNVSSEPVSDGTDNTEDLSSDSSTSVSPYDGIITADANTKSSNERTDAHEIKPVIDGSNLATNYKGYAEDARKKLRDEILNTPNTENFYKLKGKIYYVSTKGNNANDGLSPEKPIQTLDAIGGLFLEPGDAVLFERGCIWRMLEAFPVKEGITYGSYGEGRKPMFYGSAKNFAQEVWKPSKKKNVWQISYMYEYPGHLIINQGEEHGYRKLSIGAVEKNTDFYVDEANAVLYLYCDEGNPSNVWNSIEVGQETKGLYLPTGASGVIFDNLALRYSAGFSGRFGNNNWAVTNCEVGYTGGGRYNSTSRQGNGIGAWCGGENLNWSHNWVYQTFDTGISPQGREGKNANDYHNIKICNNLLEFNNCDIETWETCADSEKGGRSDFYDVYMDNNICRFTALGWGTRIDDGGIRGIDGVLYGRFLENQITGHVSFSNNIIDCPGRMIYNFTTYNKAVYDAWIRENNVYYIKQSLRTTEHLTYKFHWSDDATCVQYHDATTKQQTLNAFAEFEPDATVYWNN